MFAVRFMGSGNAAQIKDVPKPKPGPGPVVIRVGGAGVCHSDLHHGSTPYGSVVSMPYWGSRTELMEVIAMARERRIRAEVTQYPLNQATDVYARLEAGQIRG